MAKLTVIAVSLLMLIPFAQALKPCPDGTGPNSLCNFDDTHRVCAKIGNKESSFFKLTGQHSWCSKKGGRCSPEHPYWCICKWAAATWIKGQGCDASVEIDCEATDVCDLKIHHTDYGYQLKPAHDCMKIKCKKQWDACPSPKSK